MSALITALACLVGLMIAGLYAALVASLYHFRGAAPAPSEPLPPMTLIKPVRGLDDGMRENFEAIVESDPGGVIQVLIALESSDDEAAPVVRAFKAQHPERDIQILYTGPAKGRMGKIHNMIEALPHAKHPRVIFSDADIRTTPGLVRGTARAFQDGYEAIFGLPYHVYVPDLGGWMFRVAFNHNFSVAAALGHYAGHFHFAAGAWMAYTKDVLERAGGLEPFAHVIADDFAISDKVRRVGARQYLLHELVPVSETGTGAVEAFVHLAKWCSIIRWSLPGIYFALPLLNPGVQALALVLCCELTGDRVWLGRGLMLGFLASRSLAAFLQDRVAARLKLPLWEYLTLFVIDLGYIPFWLCGLRKKIKWRGVVYRLHTGGIAEVLSAPDS